MFVKARFLFLFIYNAFLFSSIVIVFIISENLAFAAISAILFLISFIFLLKWLIYSSFTKFYFKISFNSG